MWPDRSRRRGGGSPTALFVTYTMANPFAVGVFYRALRLGGELRSRGWSVVVANLGPVPDDPKVAEARRWARIVPLEASRPEVETGQARDLFRRTGADVVVFGEEPMPGTAPFFRAARMGSEPLVTLDQFYDPGVVPTGFGVDLAVLYGLAPLFAEPAARGRGRCVVVPPFIGEVAPPGSLLMPEEARGRPWLTVLGLDPSVLEGGVQLLADLGEPRPWAVTLSPDPRDAERRMEAAGIPPGDRLALPLPADPVLFGLLAVSRVAVVGNGFMQIVEALALGCPVVGIDRGIGLWSGTLDRAYRPWASLWEDRDTRLRRVRGWLAEPARERGLAALRDQRGGAAVAADWIERVVRSPSPTRRLQRLGVRARWTAARGLSRVRGGLEATLSGPTAAGGAAGGAPGAGAGEGGVP